MHLTYIQHDSHEGRIDLERRQGKDRAYHDIRKTVLGFSFLLATDKITSHLFLLEATDNFKRVMPEIRCT